MNCSITVSGTQEARRAVGATVAAAVVLVTVMMVMNKM